MKDVVDPEAEYMAALAVFHAAVARLQRARGRLIASRVWSVGATA
jgi:hypothetical protein